MLKNKKNNHSHYKCLDGLRGVAALLVVLAHMEPFFGTLTSTSNGYSQTSFLWKCYNILCNGHFAVSIFFVLSGFVLLIAYSERLEQDYLAISVVKRYFRLTPVILCSLILTYLFYIIFGYWSKSAGIAIGGYEWLMNEGGIPNLKGVIAEGLWRAYLGKINYNGVLWTISIELWGSIFAFAFAALFFKYKRYPTIVILASGILVFTLGQKGFYFSLFLFGSLLLYKQTWRLSWHWFFIGIFLGTQSPWTPFVVFFNKLNIPFNVPIYVIFNGMGAIILVSTILRNGFLKRIFESPFTTWLGRISFSLYTCHLIILKTIGSKALVVFFQKGHLRLGAGMAMILTLLISFVVAELMTRFIDAPSQRFASIVSNKILLKNNKLTATKIEGSAQ